MREALMARLALFGGRNFRRTFLGILAVGIALSYAGAIGAGFYFDDSYGITENPSIRSLANVPGFFTDPFTLTTMRPNVDIRPVLLTTYAISGVEPWSYHVFNLILHFLTSVVVFLLVRDHVWWPESQRGPRARPAWSRPPRPCSSRWPRSTTSRSIPWRRARRCCARLSISRRSTRCSTGASWRRSCFTCSRCSPRRSPSRFRPFSSPTISSIATAPGIRP